MFCMIMLFHGHPEIKSRKKRENVCLDECHQQFQESHEYAESNGYRGNGRTQHAFDIAENKDQAHEAEDDDMPGGNVSKETDHEDERLGNNSHELDNGHERYREFQPPGHARGIVNMFPVILIRAESGDNECEHSHDAGHGNVARYVGPEGKEWDQAHEVVQEDEEEYR